MTKKASLKLTPTYYKIDDLKPHPKNYREHPEDQMLHIAKSIKDNGVYRNVVLARDLTILAGHGVVKTAKEKLGFKEILGIKLDIDPMSPKALKILAGDNEQGRLAIPDDKALAEILKEIHDFEPEELLGTGFNKEMLANLIFMSTPPTDPAFDAAKHWVGMPEFNQQDTLQSWQSIHVHFRTKEDRALFAERMEQTVNDESRWIWFPKLQLKRTIGIGYYSDEPHQPLFPIYIVSKGRWKSRLTSKALEAMKVPYFIIVEEQEYSEYANVIDPSKILVLDKSFQQNYDTCDDLGNTKSKGPGAARNFAWEHAIANGHAFHWVMDDNIRHFVRLHDNEKIRGKDGTILRAMEDFVLRYENIAIAGPDYEKFAPRRYNLPPFLINTRIYSCNLIRNDLPFRWRGRYNEDTDLSLRALKAGWCTVQFYAFLQEKVTTQTIKGGNTKEFYEKEGTLEKSRMQVKLHPDVSTLVRKFNRWHHQVDYSIFKKNQLQLKPDAKIDFDFDYGMKVKEVSGEKK